MITETICSGPDENGKNDYNGPPILMAKGEVLGFTSKTQINMTDLQKAQLKLECLKIAADWNSMDVLKTAQELYDFISSN